MDPYDACRAKFLHAMRLPAPMVNGECEVSTRMARAFLFVPSYFPTNELPAADQGKLGAKKVPFVYMPGRVRHGGWTAEDPVYDAGLNENHLVILKSCAIQGLDFDGFVHGDVDEYVDDSGALLGAECFEQELPGNFEALVVDAAYCMVQAYLQHLHHSCLGKQRVYILSSMLSPLKRGGTNLVITAYFPDGKRGHPWQLPFDIPCIEGGRCYVVPRPLIYRFSDTLENYDVVFRSGRTRLSRGALVAAMGGVVGALGKAGAEGTSLAISGHRETGRGSVIVHVRRVIAGAATSADAFYDALRAATAAVAAEHKLQALKVAHANKNLPFNDAHWVVKRAMVGKADKLIVCGKYTATVGKREYLEEMSNFSSKDSFNKVVTELEKDLLAVAAIKAKIIEMSDCLDNPYEKVSGCLLDRANACFRALFRKLHKKASAGPLHMLWELEFRGTVRVHECSITAVGDELTFAYNDAGADNALAVPAAGQAVSVLDTYVPEQVLPASRTDAKFGQDELVALEGVLSDILGMCDLCGMQAPPGLPPWALLARVADDGASCERYKARLAVLRMAALNYLLYVQIGQLWYDINDDLNAGAEVPLSAFAGYSTTQEVMKTLKQAQDLFHLDLTSGHVIGAVPIVDTYLNCISHGVLDLYKLPEHSVEDEPMEFQQSKRDAPNLLTSRKKQRLELDRRVAQYLCDLTEDLPLLSLQPAELDFVKKLQDVATDADLHAVMAELPRISGAMTGGPVPTLAFLEFAERVEQLPDDMMQLFRASAPALEQAPDSQQQQPLLLTDKPDSDAGDSDGGDTDEEEDAAVSVEAAEPSPDSDADSDVLLLS
ncbi:hypothetical protein HXX76_014066 [Chlamydomonas incerta]|uniref:Uncharacterized protein n=1 Tax=Chlamydomonas incerta TaxID=51695 RepID=A0A835SK18_CHLIN|nr:hypothetical protein HXX76_014066 [Chlamydomonas incerta]|eukprot:KAG2424908.1 hypothetical protein HXX76_014066 [Chlamydomonas incerta]